jgi:putrescine aminotransferase
MYEAGRVLMIRDNSSKEELMATQQYHGIPYHVWNQSTDMENFMKFFGVGPEMIVRGEGALVYNQRGTRYINGISSLWSVAAGMGRQELVEAASKQMGELAFSGCWSQVHPRAIELAARLVEITGGHYQQVMFGSNGSDAVEAALKMARQFHRQSPNLADRGRYKIISLRGSYHGFSYGCLSTSGEARNTDLFGPLLPGFVQIEPPYCYRCPYGKDGFPGYELVCAQALEEKIQAEGAETAAALIIEPVMGDFGVVAGPDEYYTRLGEICQRYGLLLIADEVTTGFGRTGKLFASQDWNPQPDILCLGKAISNGYFPVSATLATQAVYERFLGKGQWFPHGVTHGGHPVGCAVGLASIDIIFKENLTENSARVGAYLKSRLEELMTHHRVIGDVRGKGLMLAIELVQDRESKMPIAPKASYNLSNEIALLGLLFSTLKNNLCLLPPLILDESLAGEIVRIFDRAFSRNPLVKLGNKSQMLKEFILSKIRP